MLRQGAVHRENRLSWGNKTGLLRFFGNKTTQFFSGQSDWPADNSRKVRLAGMPATAGSLTFFYDYLKHLEKQFHLRQRYAIFFIIKSSEEILKMVTSFHVQCILQPPPPPQQNSKIEICPFLKALTDTPQRYKTKLCKYPWKSIFHQKQSVFCQILNNKNLYMSDRSGDTLPILSLG